jgi:hypothetical protein
MTDKITKPPMKPPIKPPIKLPADSAKKEAAEDTDFEVDPNTNAPWRRVEDLTHEYEVKIRGLIDKMMSIDVAIHNVLVDVEVKDIHRTRDGEDGEIHIDDFDGNEFRKQAKIALTMMSMENLLYIIDLSAGTRRKIMSAYIGRHRDLRQFNNSTRLTEGG